MRVRIAVVLTAAALALPATAGAALADSPDGQQPRPTNSQGNCVGVASSASTANGTNIRNEQQQRNEIVASFLLLEAPCVL